MILALKNSNFKLANNLLELLKVFAINSRRNALYPKGDWGKELELTLKEDIPFFKEHLEISQVCDFAKELIEFLEIEPPEVIKLEEKLEWLASKSVPVSTSALNPDGSPAKGWAR